MTQFFAFAAWCGQTIWLMMVLFTVVLCVAIWRNSDEMDCPAINITGNTVHFWRKRKDGEQNER